MEKVCIKCKCSKPVIDFAVRSKNKDGYANWCKECKRDYDNKYYSNFSKEKKKEKVVRQRDRINNIRQWIFDYLKDKQCIKCGESHIATLDFHHIKDKSFNVSIGVGAGYSLHKIKSEIEKCEILCSNCHRKITSDELNWYKGLK